jgi:hypothetical protein
MLFYKEAKTLNDILIMSACAVAIPIGITFMIFGRPRHVIVNGKLLLRSISKKGGQNLQHGMDNMIHAPQNMYHLVASARGKGFTFPHAQHALHQKLHEAVHAVHMVEQASSRALHGAIHGVEHALHLDHFHHKPHVKAVESRTIEASLEADSPTDGGPKSIDLLASPEKQIILPGIKSGGAAKVYVESEEPAD